MITKRQMPVSEYTDKVVKRNGIYYKYLYPKTVDENTYLVCEMSFITKPTQAIINEEIAKNLVLYKNALLVSIGNYDTSDNVNGFLLNGEHCWLDKATRVGLINSINIEKLAGKSTTTLYFNGVAYTINVDDALTMLSNIELYAIDCYRVTEQHRIDANAFTDLEDVIDYDYTEGYPAKLEFTI